MRRVIWLLLGLAVVLLAACSTSQPDIAIDVVRHEFGIVPQGELAIADIPLRNIGSGNLEIEAVSTSCGCTSAEVQPTTIPAGGEGTLHIEYNSGFHPDVGSIQRYVYVVSNDPDEPEIEVILTANVEEQDGS